MSNKYKDFDAMFPEIAAKIGVETPEKQGTIKIFGKKYTFSKNPPMILMLTLSRYSGEKNIPFDAVIRLAYGLYGDETINEIGMNPKFTPKMLYALVEHAINCIYGKDDDAEQSGVTEDDFGVRNSKKN